MLRTGIGYYLLKEYQFGFKFLLEIVSICATTVMINNKKVYVVTSRISINSLFQDTRRTFVVVEQKREGVSCIVLSLNQIRESVYNHSVKVEVCYFGEI